MLKIQCDRCIKTGDLQGDWTEIIITDQRRKAGGIPPDVYHLCKLCVVEVEELLNKQRDVDEKAVKIGDV